MVSIFLPIVINNIVGLICGISIFILLVLDWNILKSFGKNTFSKWWALFPPVYLFKRAKRLETKQTYFQIYMGLWISFIALLIVFMGSKSILERSACETVTKMIEQQYHQPISCKSVSIIESQGKYHSAIAELSNGNTFDIEITETGTGNILVEIYD